MKDALSFRNIYELDKGLLKTELTILRLYSHNDHSCSMM